MRYIGAAVVLSLAGLIGLLAWTAETCTGNAPDSLNAGVITLALNVVGIAMLAWRPRPDALVRASLLPCLLAIYYSGQTGAFAIGYFANGTGACEVITGYGPWGVNGDEPFFLALWIPATLVFWCGLAFAGWRAYRIDRKDAARESAV